MENPNHCRHTHSILSNSLDISWNNPTFTFLEYYIKRPQASTFFFFFPWKPPTLPSLLSPLATSPLAPHHHRLTITAMPLPALSLPSINTCPLPLISPTSQINPNFLIPLQTFPFNYISLLLIFLSLLFLEI